MPFHPRTVSIKNRSRLRSGDLPQHRQCERHRARNAPERGALCYTGFAIPRPVSVASGVRRLEDVIEFTVVVQTSGQNGQGGGPR
jgi:hypothetical protein